MSSKKKKEVRIPGSVKRLRAFLVERIGQPAMRKLTHPEEYKDDMQTRGVGERRQEVTSSIKKFNQNRLTQLRKFRERARQYGNTSESSKDESSRSLGFIGPPNNNWIPIGPSGAAGGQAASLPIISGRANGFAFSPQSERIYISTSNGGIWRSTDQGDSWEPLMRGFDLNPGVFQSDSLTFGAVALESGANASEDTIYGGSGEGQSVFGLTFRLRNFPNPNPSTNFITGQGAGYLGVGPIISKDGGLNWLTEESTPSLFNHAFFAMVVDPNPNIQGRVIAATTLGVYRREIVDGKVIWNHKIMPPRATDPGPIAVAQFSWSTSIVAAFTGGDTTFYAVSNEFSPAPNAINRSRLYTSSDGDTWTLVGNDLLGAQRATLAVQRNNPGIIYAFRANGSIFRMDRADDTWIEITVQNPANPGPASIPNNIVSTQGAYDLAITIDPTDVNTIYVGGSTVRSDIAGNLSSEITDEFAGAIYRLTVTVNDANVSATWTYIGGSCHADIHMLVFPPNISSQLWVACDGGIFSTNTPRTNGMIFQARNAGLQTLSVNRLAGHPLEEGYFFCATQDNGSIRYTGDELWQLATAGDSGAIVVDWNNPNRVIATSFNNGIRRTIAAGDRTQYTGFQADGVSIDLQGDNTLFYSPMVGPPPIPIQPDPNIPHDPSHADIVAFGAQRPWISTNFGGNTSDGGITSNNNGWGDWHPIRTRLTPASTPANSRRAVARIRSMAFANAQTLYVGTTNGNIYRYVSADINWTNTTANIRRTRIDTIDGTNSLNNFLLGVYGTNAPEEPDPFPPITSIAVDPFNAQAIYITLGGNGDPDHVWYFDGTTWTARSGNIGTNTNLIDVQFNSIVAIPNPTGVNATNVTLYAGADIGIWASLDSGRNWRPFSSGLPDSAVLDLNYIPSRTHLGKTRPAILRAATHGRGVFERTLTNDPQNPIQLYIRDTPMDLGRYPTDITGTLQNPLQPGTTISTINSPDIKIDTLDENGNYQFSISSGKNITFDKFVDRLIDRSGQVAVNENTNIRSRVYVQIHNRGIENADKVQVHALIAPAQPTIPELPNNYHQKVQAGEKIEDRAWQTVDIKSISNVNVGLPKVVFFDLDMSFFPRITDLTGRDQYCLLILLHHHADSYDNEEKNLTSDAFLAESKATYKILTITRYTGAIPTLTADNQLNGYLKVPEVATDTEAPFDPFLSQAFMQNDQYFRQLFQSALGAPLNMDGAEENVVNPDPKRVVAAKNITITEPIETIAGVPLLWYATEKIIIQAKISATGKGANSGEQGDFGGSGGGAHEAGLACRFPIRGQELLAGGTGGNNSKEGVPMEIELSEIVLMLAFGKGGAAGGNDKAPEGGANFAKGGAGGGIIFLCAPSIEIVGNGRIVANGQNGGQDISGISGDAGGGGGGTIVLLTYSPIGININQDDESRNVEAKGGEGLGNGKKGGDGKVYTLTHSSLIVN